jgi:exodeoxyribonuclease VII large subunit
MHSSCEKPEPGDLEIHGEKIWSVTQLTRLIKSVIEDKPEFYAITVRGEVTNLSRSKAGHIYFGLKDEQSYLKCVAFRGSAERLKTRPEEGREVIARGQVTVYEAGGTYQLIVSSIEEVGAGALWLKFEELRRRLEAEGLFDERLKRPLPPFPRVIGLVTSRDGAALRDMLRIFRERAPWVRCVLSPSLVQGETAPESLVRAIDLLESWSEMEKTGGGEGIDLMIIGRGGGSFEDLACFNDEKLARRIRAAGVPVISAVGHEVDFTIADFTADLRAATPTQAAAIAVPDVNELLTRIDSLLAEYRQAADLKVDTYSTSLQNVISRPVYLRPLDRLNSARQSIDGLIQRATKAGSSRLAIFRHRLESLRNRLAALDPVSILSRGYSLAFLEDSGKLIIRTSQTSPGIKVDLRVSDGTIKLRVREGTENQ